MREKIELTDSIKDILVKMSEGNFGAVRVLTDLIKSGDTGVMLVLHLDDMNIRGSQIWVGYKDFCGEDLQKFKLCIINRDQGMIDYINKECSIMLDENGAAIRAVNGGGSRR